MLALWLERKFSKTEILELYLNRVYFGAGAYGIEAAAQRYFGKPAQKLTRRGGRHAGRTGADRRRGWRRAAIPTAPSGARRSCSPPWRSMKFVTDDTAQGRADRSRAQAVKATRRGLGQLRRRLGDGRAQRSDRPRRRRTSSSRPRSIPILQAAAEKALVDELAQNGEKVGVGQGALVSMTPDGAVRALVGGRNYAESQFNRAVAAKRQPGSAFKPFVYLTAIERGLTPDTVREDKPISIKGWKPENYSREYFGPVTLKQALAMSLNTVSVRLTLEFGPPAVMRTAHRLGIASKLEPNASIALGTSEVSLLELVGAYAPFANGGIAIAPHVVERVRTANGKVLYTREQQSLGRIIEPRYVAMMNAHDARDAGHRHGAQGRRCRAGRPPARPAPARISATPGSSATPAHLVTGVWLGNDDNSPTKKTTGGGMPVEIWTRFMQPAHQGVAGGRLPGCRACRDRRLAARDSFGAPAAAARAARSGDRRAPARAQPAARASTPG